VSNIALSASEDVAAISLTWIATQHPYVAGGIACVGIVFLVFSLRWIAVRLKRMWRGMFTPRAADGP
jgi:hypothetical protein